MPVTPEPDPDFSREDAQELDASPHKDLSECIREAPLTALLTAFLAGLFVGRLVL
jgi:hypothetical protein